MKPRQNELLEIEPCLPWEVTDDPKAKFAKLVQAIRDSLETDSDHVDLDVLCDRYLRTIWDLAVAAPLQYLEGHPFDLRASQEFRLFELENKTKGQAKRMSLKPGDTARKAKGLTRMALI